MCQWALMSKWSSINMAARQLSFDCCEMNPNKKRRTESGNTDADVKGARGDVEKPEETQY